MAPLASTLECPAAQLAQAGKESPPAANLARALPKSPGGAALAGTDGGFRCRGARSSFGLPTASSSLPKRRAAKSPTTTGVRSYQGLGAARERGVGALR